MMTVFTGDYYLLNNPFCGFSSVMTVIGITRCLMTLWTLITNDINSNYSFMNKLHFNWILISDEIALIILLFTKILINNDSNSNHELLNNFSLLGFSSVMTTLLNSFCLIRLCKMIIVYSKYHFFYIILLFISLFLYCLNRICLSVFKCPYSKDYNHSMFSIAALCKPLSFR